MWERVAESYIAVTFFLLVVAGDWNAASAFRHERRSIFFRADGFFHSAISASVIAIRE
jgi:hypothetical protein